MKKAMKNTRDSYKNLSGGKDAAELDVCNHSEHTIHISKTSSNVLLTMVDIPMVCMLDPLLHKVMICF